MERLYEHWIDPEKVFSSIVKNRSNEYYANLAGEVKMTIKHFGRKPDELEFFDFGMGWSERCRMAKAQGCSVFGTELSQTRLDYAKASGISVIQWEEIPQHQFDFINTEQVFEHIAKPLDTLYHLSQALKPQGVIKISVPNGWNIKKRLTIMDWTAPKGTKNSLNPVAPLEHINCFSSNSIVKMGEIAGLMPVQLRTQIRMDRTLLNITPRDILSPWYHRLNRKKSSKVFLSQKSSN